jgi:hypothetical protein
MAAPSAHEVTRLLQAWSAGDERALEQLVHTVCSSSFRFRALVDVAFRQGGTIPGKWGSSRLICPSNYAHNTLGFSFGF